jgi:hypothetical protein
MKEATGELNMTVIAVVAIAAVGAFFYAFIWPQISRSIRNNTRCSDAICEEGCTGTCDCQYIDDEGQAQTITCKVKGGTAD